MTDPRISRSGLISLEYFICCDIQSAVLKHMSQDYTGTCSGPYDTVCYHQMGHFRFVQMIVSITCGSSPPYNFVFSIIQQQRANLRLRLAEGLIIMQRRPIINRKQEVEDAAAFVSHYTDINS